MNTPEDAAPPTARKKMKREAEARDAAMLRLPRIFQAPGEFRLKMEQGSEPVPRLSVPAFPVYLVLSTFIVWWCRYSWQYHKAHDHSSVKALLVFFVVFAVPLLALLMFKDFHELARLYPLLKRMAGKRAGAFLVVNGGVPTLFYARAGWIGQVIFEDQSEDDDASTRLVARIKEPQGWLEVRRKQRRETMRENAGQDAIQLPESEFTRTFAVSGSNEEFARSFLSPQVTGAIMRLSALGNPRVHVDGSTVRMEVAKNLSAGYREAELRRFLDDAETVMESVSDETISPPGQ